MAETKTVSESSKINELRKALMVYVVVFTMWGLYRLLFRFPLELEEIVFKPLVFLPLVLSVLLGEGKRGMVLVKALGFNRKELLISVYFGLTFGVVFLLAVRLGSFVFSGYETTDFGFLFIRFFQLAFLSFVTAVWEQVLFSGFLLRRVFKAFRDEWSSVSLVAFLFVMLHVPALLLEPEILPVFASVELALLFFVGFGNAVLMLRTKNILAPILAHSLWAVAIGMFM